MSNKGYQINVSQLRYPGNDYFYVLCDVCGKKFRKKDTIQIQDRFNLQNQLLVCFNDVDKVNAQSRPFKCREYKAPDVTRPEPAVYPSIPNPNSDRAPGIVTGLIALGDPLSDSIDLYWNGPDQGGSDPVTGYVIYQSIPQLTFPQVICANTLSGVPFYQDTITDQSTFCTYQVAALNEFGMGPLSAVAFWPIAIVDGSMVYLDESQSPNGVLTTGDGEYIILPE